MSERPLLLDTNLVVLYVVGMANRSHIPTFKRTSNYDVRAFELLSEFLSSATKLFSTPHILAEASNLSDLSGEERLRARTVLANFIATSQEHYVSAATTIQHESFHRLGLTDAAIHLFAQGTPAEVLTDDLDLFLSLQRHGVAARNFSRLRAQWGGPSATLKVAHQKSPRRRR